MRLSTRLGRLKIALGIVVAVIGIGLAACGGSSGGSQPSSSPASSHAAGWA